MDMIVDDMLNRETYVHTTEEALFEWIAKEGSKEVTRERRVKYMEHIVSSVCESGLRLDVQKANTDARLTLCLLR
jgi:hypothetical protein